MPTEQVESPIFEGAAKRAWVPSKVHPGLVRATLHVRSHTAVVDIAYSNASFRISYADSQDLDYSVDGGTPSVHRNYNSWVTNLSTDILRTLHVRSQTLPRAAQ